MAKFKKTIVPDIQAKHEFEREQEELKQKHQLETDKIIIEKNNMVKFTVNTVKDGIRLLATILVFVLAAIGLIGLIYPEPRQELWEVGKDIYLQLKMYLPFLS